ncbi:hypothetical protein GCM10022214_11090 [Actinomadura miaoliensis]|uniref:TfoX/Sxy family protein n=1 Tax=Actinomadura miaoliensis TaxID=430685 RepID=A0ABP7V5Q5_9ACTN
MTAGPVAGARPWAVEVDVDQVLAELRRRFPGVEIWHGAFTGSLWGLVYDRSGDAHLIEADTPVELGQRLYDAGARSPLEPTGVPGAGGMVADLWSSPTSTQRSSVSPPPPHVLPRPSCDVPLQQAPQPRATSPQPPLAARQASRPSPRPQASRPSSSSRQGWHSSPPPSRQGARSSPSLVRSARAVRGRHEVERRRGWLRRLLDRLTWTEDW